MVFLNGEVCSNEISTADNGSNIVVECTPTTAGTNSFIVRSQFNGEEIGGTPLQVDVNGVEQIDLTPIVFDVKPLEANVGTPVEFKITGRFLPHIEIYLDGGECERTNNSPANEVSVGRDPLSQREIFLITCTPNESGQKNLEVRNEIIGQAVEGGVWLVDVAEPSIEQQIQLTLQGTWRASNQLSLPNGTTASFDFRIQFSGNDAVYTERFETEVDCGVLVAEQSVRSSYEIADNKLELRYEETKPQVVDRCENENGDYFSQTNEYFEGDITIYDLSLIHI